MPGAMVASACARSPWAGQGPCVAWRWFARARSCAPPTRLPGVLPHAGKAGRNDFLPANSGACRLSAQVFGSLLFRHGNWTSRLPPRSALLAKRAPARTLARKVLALRAAGRSRRKQSARFKPATAPAGAAFFPRKPRQRTKHRPPSWPLRAQALRFTCSGYLITGGHCTTVRSGCGLGMQKSLGGPARLPAAHPRPLYWQRERRALFDRPGRDDARVQTLRVALCALRAFSRGPRVYQVPPIALPNAARRRK